MTILRLLLIALVCHLSGMAVIAQEEKESGESSSMSGKDLKTAAIGVPIITATLIGGAVIIYELMRAGKGKGSYHINQFRIHFLGTDGVLTPLALSRQLEEKFPEVFAKSRVATAKRISVGDPVIIRFTPHNLPAWAFSMLTWRRRHDDVVLSRPDPHASVFQGITLDPKSDPYGNNKKSTQWFRWVNAQLDSLAYCHFLAGTRSWRIGIVDQPADASHSSNQVTFFLETAAFERSSSHLMANLPFLRGMIRTVWCDFVHDALKLLKIPPYSPPSIGALDAPAMAGISWSKWTLIPVSHPEHPIGIWYREVQISPDKIAAFGSDAYANRLFELHPGLKKEFELV